MGKWLERNVSYGVTVARGQTHPGPLLHGCAVDGVLARARHSARYLGEFIPCTLCVWRVRSFVRSLQVMDILHTTMCTHNFPLHVNNLHIVYKISHRA